MTRHKHVRKFLGISMLALFGGVQAAGMAPDDRVRAASAAVVAALESRLVPRELERIARAELVPYFDFERMTHMVLGPAWHDATPTQQQALTREFGRMVLRSYVETLALGAQTGMGVAAEPLPGPPVTNEVLVQSLILRPGPTVVELDHLVVRSARGWLIADVAVDRESLVSAHSERFATVIAEQGITGLLRALAESNRGKSILG